MDFLNKAKEQFSQNSGNQGQQGGMDPNQQGQNTGAFGGGNNPGQQQGMNTGAFGGGNNNNIAGGANNSGQEDYGDKGMHIPLPPFEPPYRKEKESFFGSKDQRNELGRI
jgi:hypothetical protein